MLYGQPDYSFTPSSQPFSKQTFNPSDYANTQSLVDLAHLAPLVGRGVGGPTAAGWSRLSPLAMHALTGTEVAGLGAGLYSLNSHDEHPIQDTMEDLALAAIASKAAGAANNSRWFANGSPALSLAARAAAPSLGQAGAGALLGAKQRVPSGGLSALLPDAPPPDPTAENGSGL